MFPLDPRETVFVPKYNPTRTWTAEGAVGIGGPCYRDLSGRVGRAATSCSAGRFRSTTSSGATPCSGTIRCSSAPATGSSSTGSRRRSCCRRFAGRPRRSLPLPDRGQPVRPRHVPRVAADDRRGGGGAAPAREAAAAADARAMRSIEVLEGGIQTTVQDYPGPAGDAGSGVLPGRADGSLRAAGGQPARRATRRRPPGSRSRSATFALRLDGDATDRGLRRRGGGHRRRRERRRRGRATGSPPGPSCDRLCAGPRFPLLPRGRRRLRRPAASSARAPPTRWARSAVSTDGRCRRVTGCRSASRSGTATGARKRFRAARETGVLP